MKIPVSRRNSWLNTRAQTSLLSGDFPGQRVLYLIAITSLAIGIVATWAVHHTCFPVISEAISNLPETSTIRAGLLEWPSNSPQCLSANRTISIEVDLTLTSQVGRDSDVTIKFGQRSARIYSIAGFIEIPYAFDLPFNRTWLEPWWKAWKDIVPVIATALTSIGMLILWTMFNLLILTPLTVVGSLIAGRRITLKRCVMIGYLSLTFTAPALALAPILYAISVLDILHFLALVSLHFLLAVLVTLTMTAFLPPRPTINPFAKPDAGPTHSPEGRDPNKLAPDTWQRLR